jgi:hypothetical protein
MLTSADLMGMADFWARSRAEIVGVYEETTKSEQRAWLACGPVYMPAACIGRKTKSPLAHQ